MVSSSKPASLDLHDEKESPLEIPEVMWEMVREKWGADSCGTQGANKMSIETRVITSQQ